LSDANRSGIGNSDNVCNDAKFMLSANSRKLTALGICILFLGLTILSIVSSSGLRGIHLEEDGGDYHTSSSSTMNINGTESGSVFSNSVLDFGSTGPVVILNNGTSVEWVYGSPVYTDDEVVTTSEPCAILLNYSLYCEGQNNYGQLGLGSTSSSSGFVSLNAQPAVVDSGNDHSCAILLDASLWCWGRNNHGQIGDGSTNNQVSPIQIDLGTGVDAVAVSAGNDHTCAITGAGDVMCWGYNIRGALGDGTTSDSTSPISANHSTGERAVALVTPGRSTCVIFENGSVGCWGNKYTVFADQGTVTGNVHIVDLGTSVTATMIDGVGQHTCVVTDNGSMQCWGVNTHGQLGDGNCSSTINSNCSSENMFPGEGDPTVSVNLSSGITVIAAATGSDSTCALLSDDSLRCWGKQDSEWFDNTSDSMLNPYEMTFADGANVAYSDQDIDGDGIRNIFDTHQTGDNDGDGVIDTNDDYPNNPVLWVNCPSGQYGRFVCTDTDAGYFALSGSLIQEECVAGTFQPNSGQSECLDVSAGHYSDSAASANQTVCASGYYQSNIGQSSCVAASAGSYVNSNRGDAGDSNVTSVPLSAMSANYTGALNSNTDTTDVFSINIPRDTWFSANLTSPSSMNYDIDLLNSTFDIVDFSATSEVSEEVSTTSVNNESGIYYIRIIHVSGSGTGDYYLVINHLSTTGSQNQIGSTSFQVNAELGTASSECGSGTWQNQSAQTSCNDAQPGYYVYGTGATSQIACLAGYYQPASGSTGCIIASPGYYVPTSAATTQTAASSGYFVNSSGASTQQPCSAGTYQPLSAQTTCFAANAGYFVPISGSSEQTPCSPGTYQPLSGQSSCLAADSGYHVPNSASTNQTACSVGTYQPYTSQANCLNADPGHYVDTAAAISQRECPVGTYQPAFGQSSCIDAQPGYYVNSTASSTQFPCPAGTYQPLGTQSDCLSAQAGFYVDTQAAISQIPCLAGTYNPSMGADDAADCMPADLGHFVPLSGSVSQTPCNVGTYAANTGQTSCDAADMGHYVPDTMATSQIVCDVGYWQNQIGQTSCNIADPGHYVDSTAAVEQISCNIGSYNPDFGSNDSSACLYADAGYYVDTSGSSLQTPCNAGTYQPSSGNSECIDADFGYHVPSEAATGQVGCTMGSYQDERAGIECHIADSGHFVDTHFASAQIACLAGTYNPSTGSTSINDCLDANPGYFVADPGSSLQQVCIFGTYQPNAGWSWCLIADSGYYVDSMAAIAQIACPIGTFNPDTGSVTSSVCKQADPGHYVDSEASSAQVPCSPGYYQNQRGQSECKSAKAGYYVSVSAATSETAAPLDNYVPENASTDYIPCPIGTLTMVEGVSDVNDCHIDTDGDRIPDFLDQDDDADGINDGPDRCDFGVMNWTSTRSNDWDADGCRDSDEDDDDDNDGYPDSIDVMPYDSSEWIDTDGDGIGNNADTDDDGDGIPDAEEFKLGLDPLIADHDGDGYNDSVDAFPRDASEWLDTDGDGLGDNSDKFPTIRFYQTYGQLAVHLLIGLFALAVISFSIKMGMGRKEKAEAEDNTHEAMEIGEVSVPVSSNNSDMFEDEDSNSVSMFKPQPVETSFETKEDESQPSGASDLDLGEILQSVPPPPTPRIEAPSDAQVNEHGQKVWRDDEGTVWAQNLDGSLLKYNILTGGWDSY